MAAIPREKNARTPISPDPFAIAKSSPKTSRSLRLYLSLTGQFDTTQGEVVNPGGNGVLGALVSW